MHETAEEQIVHPWARRHLNDGDKIVNARLDEEQSATQVVAALEAMELNTAQFDDTFASLKAAVIAHAEQEEQEEFEQLQHELDAEQLHRMATAV